jgi:hypothetical protein
MQKKLFVFIALGLIACFSLMIIPAIAADVTAPLSGDGALTRGQRFTITITASLNTSYYIWLARTYSLSGEPGDQPPVIASNQWNVVQDPAGGPYPIGSYAYNNGGGRTILDDVAPSTAAMSNTRYYALVTTDAYGRSVVEFQTSVNTALRSFSVRVENPQSAQKENIVVQQGDVGVKRGSVSIEAVPPVTAQKTPSPTQPPTTVPTQTPSPEPTTGTVIPTPVPTQTPVKRAPLEIGVCLLAAGLGLLAVRKR